MPGCGGWVAKGWVGSGRGGGAGAAGRRRRPGARQEAPVTAARRSSEVGGPRCLPAGRGAPGRRARAGGARTIEALDRRRVCARLLRENAENLLRQVLLRPHTDNHAHIGGSSAARSQARTIERGMMQRLQAPATATRPRGHKKRLPNKLLSNGDRLHVSGSAFLDEAFAHACRRPIATCAWDAPAPHLEARRALEEQERVQELPKRPRLPLGRARGCDDSQAAGASGARLVALLPARGEVLRGPCTRDVQQGRHRAPSRDCRSDGRVRVSTRSRRAPGRRGREQTEPSPSPGLRRAEPSQFDSSLPRHSKAPRDASQGLVTGGLHWLEIGTYFARVPSLHFELIIGQRLE